MMTAMERSISPYEERGSEASMADSLGIKDAAKESSKGQNFKDADSDGTGSTQMDQMDPGTGASVAKIATLMTSLQKMVDYLRAGDKQTLEALTQDPPPSTI